VDSNGKLLTHDQFCKQYSFQVNFLEYRSVLKAIPKRWITEITNDVTCKKGAQIKSEDIKKVMCDKILKLTSKQVYWYHMTNLIKQPTAVEKWIEEFPFLHDDDFGDIFVLAQSTGDTMLQSFQYKILNRIFPCNYMLKKWAISSTDRCLCGEIDTIEHFFYYCKNALAFWKQVEKWFSLKFNVNIPLKILDILMGIPHMKTQDKLLDILNFIIIHGKWFIYRGRKEDKMPCFASFRRYFKYKVRIKIELFYTKFDQVDPLWEMLFNLM